MAANRIILTLGIGGWLARYEGPHREDVVRLFETDVLPTAFTYEAQASLVREEIAKLNPGAVVEIR